MITEYNEQLYANKFNNADEMDKFLEEHKQVKFIQKVIGNFNNSVTVKKKNTTEFVVKAFSQIKL